MNGIKGRFMVRFFAVVFAATSLLSTNGCSDNNGDSGNGGTIVDPQPQPCEVNGTAIAVFKNESQRSTYDVIVDGAGIGSINPKQSITTVVSAGKHRVEFRFSNTTTRACTPADADFPQCTSKVVWCTSDR